MSHRPPFASNLQRECFSACPPVLASYASQHLDSIGKITNHVLAITLICNVFLFLASCNVAVLPNIGINAVMISFLLIAQTVFVFLILNNNVAPSLRFLSATPMMVGVALGITIGAAVVALIVTNAYKRISSCGHTSSIQPYINMTNSDTLGPESFGNPVYEYYCKQHVGALTAVWFWSGLVFWFNFCTCLLLSVGQEELVQQGRSQYEHIGNGAPPSAASQQYHGDSSASVPPPFVGDYSNIPEIRSVATESSGIGNRSQASTSHAQVMSV
jgi:hypothetical protein